MISDWLKDTVPGIILLGALGSLIAGFSVWFAVKLFKLLIRFNRFVLVKVFGDNLAKLGVFLCPHLLHTKSYGFPNFQ